MRIFALMYAAVLTLDGLLSLVDSAAPERHLSSVTTILLCTFSVPVLIIGTVLALRLQQRPRWPLLLASGAYSLFLVIIFGVVLRAMIAGGMSDPASKPSVSTAVSLIVAGLEVVVGGACILGALRRVNRARMSPDTA